MNVEDFTFHLPEHLIAARPVERRDSSRLLVVPPGGAPFEHRHFRDIREYLRAGDVLVMNDSRVIPARLFARRPTGGSVEIMLLHEEIPGTEPVWRALVRPGRKVKTGDVLSIGEDGFQAHIAAEHEGGERSVRFTGVDDFRAALRLHGKLPLPPYILKRRAENGPASAEQLYEESDRERYQTVYARPEGSVAAPTAGLHFTPELLEELRVAGIETTFVTLHVGAGTFQTMEEGGCVEDHVMHYEEYEVSPETSAIIAAAKREGRRVVAVGTTSVRTVESAWDNDAGAPRVGFGRTNLMIKPGFHFNVVNALVTNFHLPRSTLLLLVSALVGRERLLAAYEEAIAKEYRFFSYGDAMFLQP